MAKAPLRVGVVIRAAPAAMKAGERRMEPSKASATGKFLPQEAGEHVSHRHGSESRDGGASVEGFEWPPAMQATCR